MQLKKWFQRKFDYFFHRKTFKILDNMPIGVLDVNIEGEIFYANKIMTKELPFLKKTKHTSIFRIIDKDFWNFLIDQLKNDEIVSSYQKKINNRIYQLTIKKINSSSSISYLLFFTDRTKEIEYESKIEEIMTDLELTVKKRTRSAEIFKELLSKITSIDSKINNENYYLTQLFNIGVDLIEKVDAGAVYLFEKGKVNFIYTLGHSKMVLNKSNISVLDFEFPTRKLRYVKNITKQTSEKFNRENKADKLIDYQKGVIPIKETIIIGLEHNNRIIGGMTYEISTTRKVSFSEEDKEFFRVLASVFNSYYSNFKFVEEQELIMNEEKALLKNELMIDDLTGISNKKHFNELLEKQWNISKLKKENVSIIMMDIDYFKLFNDYYGHVKGDFVLKEVAKALKLREDDIVARYGGEEFIALFNGLEHDSVMEIAERIRESVELLNIENFKVESNRKLTISLGVATTNKFNEMEPIELINKADKKLYSSKKSGRNKVTGISIIN